MYRSLRSSHIAVLIKISATNNASNTVDGLTLPRSKGLREMAGMNFYPTSVNQK